MREPAAEEAVAARERVRSRARRSELLRDRRGELGRHALVRVETQHPVVSGRADGERFLRAEPRPLALDHARAPAPRDFHGIIAAARVDDDDLAGERRRREAVRDLGGGIARDHTETQGKRPGHAPRRCGSRDGVLVRMARILREIGDRSRFLTPLNAQKQSRIAKTWSVPPSGALVVRPSSLGDIVHALALVADIRAHRPELAVDWVAEEAFAPLVALDRDVRRVIPVALRRWRRRPFSTTTWREMAGFRRDLRRDEYVAVLDLQEQVKGALVARLARGPRHGPDRASIREPVATLAHEHHHAIDPDQHLIDRCRRSPPLRWATAPTARRASASPRRRPPPKRQSRIGPTSCSCTRRAAPTSCGRRRSGAR